MEWSRRVKGITSEIKYQAPKPSGEPGRDSYPLEYFTLKEWLVAGPFAIEDPVKDVEKDFLGGEDTIQPDTGGKVGKTTWKHLRAGIDTQSRHYHNEGTCGDLNVDFVYVFGNLPEAGAANDVEVPLNNKVAYADTWIHSPSPDRVMLRVNYAAAALKVFFNGRLVIDSAQVMPLFKPREGVDRVWPGEGVVYSQRLSSQRTKSRLNTIMATSEYKFMTIRNWNTTTKLLEITERMRRQ